MGCIAALFVACGMCFWYNNGIFQLVYIMTSMTDPQWRSLVNSLVQKKQEDILYKVFYESGFEPCPTQTMIDALSGRQLLSGVGVYLQWDESDHKSDKQKEQDEKNKLIIDERSKWWVKVFEQTNMSLPKLYAANYELFNWLIENKLSDALSVAVNNTDNKDLKEFLAQKSTYPLLKSSAYEKTNILGLFVITGLTDVLKTLNTKLSSWAAIVDNKQRNALFSARSKDMVSFLLKSGVDGTQASKDGQDARSFWLEDVKHKEAVNWATLVSEATDPDAAMVTKLFALDLSSMTVDQKNKFDAAAQNPNWTWTGRLTEVERTWTLPEVWRFGELSSSLPSTSTGKIKMIDMDSYYGASIGKAFHDQQSAVQSCRETLPPFIQKQWFEGPSSNSEKLIGWLMASTDKPSEIPNNVNSGYSQRNEDIQKITRAIISYTKRTWGALTPQDKQDWLVEMRPFWNTSWMYSGTFMKTKSRELAKMAVLPINDGGIACEELFEQWSQFRQNEGIRSLEFLNTWAQELIAQKSKLENNNDFQSLSSVLGIGLIMMGNPALRTEGQPYPKNSVHEKVEEILLGLFAKGVEPAKIPLRWAKNYSPALQARASAFVIQTTITQSSKKRKAKIEEDEAPKPKRRM